MENLKIKKPFGDINITYRVEDIPVLVKAEINNKIIFEGEKKLTYAMHQGKEFIGFQLFGEEYKYFCEVSGIKPNDNKGFISFSDSEHKIIKRKIKENRLKSDFEKELIEAKETGNIIIREIGMVECNDPGEECNWDHLSYEIHPNGEIKEKRQHTW